jgi:DNA-binding PadR family transcriptional regulator
MSAKSVSMLKKQTLDGHVETLLLSILIRRPSYGYRIVRELNELAPDVLKMGEGTVYPVLHRMESRGLLTAQWETDEGRPRKYYYVSRKGKKQFAAAFEQWSALQGLMEVAFASRQTTGSPKEAAL